MVLGDQLGAWQDLPSRIISLVSIFTSGFFILNSGATSLLFLTFGYCPSKDFCLPQIPHLTAAKVGEDKDI